MGTVKRQKRYLFYSVLSFILSFWGFAGLLATSRRPLVEPEFGGILLIGMGVYFLYRYFKPEEE